MTELEKREHKILKRIIFLGVLSLLSCVGVTISIIKQFLLLQIVSTLVLVLAGLSFVHYLVEYEFKVYVHKKKKNKDSKE